MAYLPPWANRTPAGQPNEFIAPRTSSRLVINKYTAEPARYLPGGGISFSPFASLNKLILNRSWGIRSVVLLLVAVAVASLDQSHDMGTHTRGDHQLTEHEIFCVLCVAAACCLLVCYWLVFLQAR